jgi:hypothetical protein
MGTILEFPQWRIQRPPTAETQVVAQIVIFPGVRIERGDLAMHHLAPLPGGPDSSPRRRRSEDRDH